LTNLYNETVEVAPISALLKNPSLYPVVEDILSKGTFGWTSFGTIYDAIKRLNNSDIMPTVYTLLADLDERGELSGIKLPSSTLTGGDAIKHIAELKEIDENQIESYALYAQRVQSQRELIRSYSRAIDCLKRGEDPSSVMAQQDVDNGKISVRLGTKSSSLQDAKTVAGQVISRYKDTVNGVVTFLKTGIKAWDEFTNGLYNGRLYIVSAVSNDGKSSLVQNILYNVCVENPIKGVATEKGVLISMEASAVDVYHKLIQRITGISALRIESGNLSEDEERIMADAIREIGNSKIVFDDSSELILPLLRTKLRKAKENGAKFAIIDQLEQILLGGAGDSQPEYIKLNFITYRIKAFARELDMPIVLVHQMNRGIDSGERRGKNVDPQIQDLAQAGEKAADAILMIRHKKSGQEILQSFFWWVKNRQGKKGFQEVEFIGKRVLFRDIPIEKENENLPDFLQNELDGMED
jgi:replicative DNA helicase